MASFISGSRKRSRIVESDNENRGDKGKRRRKNNVKTTEAKNVASVDGRTFLEKLIWAVQLNRDYSEFESLINEGRTKLHLTVRTDRAKPGRKFTKVIIFNFPTMVEPDIILLDERFVWVKRRTCGGEKRSQVVALMKGQAPEKIFIPGIGYRRVKPYMEPLAMCLKCCRWGHMSFVCQNDARCRFCGMKHYSQICRWKINKGYKIKPRCCNCGGCHNAGSLACRARPRSSRRW